MRILSNKLRNHEFQDNEKIMEIQKQNEKLMSKLFDISKGKHSSLQKILGPNMS